ncbi:hypothetical protein Poli38472_005879 [Pythium oligandrum]|uniref:Uncharacterized protein n=1 Tax=Pythium oligandrum TaxID=41045 RepID=A0A8K1CTP2_PYTOL|nr:hypothetical protein Poli38472_005879 [Pythium oligandrum]|eukprot:TMW68411.1 hypothetical protein Poli38472_005879 [Pythium oligandrum]
MSPSGKKSRRNGMEKASRSFSEQHHGVMQPEGYAYANDPRVPPSIAMAQPTPELLFQLQQLQHQNHLQQQAAVAATAYAFGGPAISSVPAAYPTYMGMAPLVHRASTGSIVSGIDDSGPPLTKHEHHSAGIPHEADFVDRIEKKDQMITQIGSFLHQIKQESEGTAQAWKEKLHEMAELKKQLSLLTSQLKESQEREQSTSQQLAQVTEDVELAVHGLKESEARHVEELKIMNEEILRRQTEADHMKTGYEESLRHLSEQLLLAQQQYQEASSRCEKLEESLRSMEAGQKLVFGSVEEQRRELQHNLESAVERIRSLETEKQDIGSHLCNVTQTLDQTKAHEEQAQLQLSEVSKELEQSRTTWTERFHSLQNEKAELLAAQSMLQSQVQTLESKLQDEQKQKEQINALMIEELQRINGNTEALHHQQVTALHQVESEREQWKSEALSYQSNFTQLEAKYNQTRSELERLQAKIYQVDEENQRLQQHGTEKASTLEEMNEQLHHTLTDLRTTTERYNVVCQEYEQLVNSIQQCYQLLPSIASADGSVHDYLETIAKALEESRQGTSVMEQMKLSMLRIQQDRDLERDRFRQREQELLTRQQTLESELETTQADAKDLAQEVQDLTRQLGGNEAKLTSQVQQLSRELDEARTNSAMQVLQLQKSLDSLKNRIHQLESEKKELLQEAEGINASMEALYQSKNEKQVELDQVKASWKELQVEVADLKETHEDLEANYQGTMEELNRKSREMQGQIHDLLAMNERLKVEGSTCMEQLTKTRADCDALGRQYATDQARWNDTDRETQLVLEDKTRRMDEMMDMLTQLQSRNEMLEQSKAVDDQSTRAEIERCQQQLSALGQEKKRLEMAYATIKSQQDQVMQELYTHKEEKRHFLQSHSEMEEQATSLKNEVLRLNSDLERATRAKSMLQQEVNRVTNEGQDLLRQFEVLRRDSRIQEKNYQDEVDRLRKEIEDLRGESGESGALLEEMQTKMTSVQNAANATINDLMAELQHAQETLTYEKNRSQKENDVLKTQVRSLEDDCRAKDADLKALNSAYRQEKDHFTEKETELNMKISRLSSALETKRHEVDKLSKDLETKGLKVAEYERKINPLTNMKDNLQTKCSELKQALDMKTREFHDVEERSREELARAVKEKRELESMYIGIKEEYELIRSQCNGQQQHLQSEARVLKQNLERTKTELMKASAEILSLNQRLESGQAASNETIAELSARLQSADQQKEMAVNALQREINLERERRRETEVQKMELQRLLRQRAGASQSAPNTSSTGNTIGSLFAPADDDTSRTTTGFAAKEVDQVLHKASMNQQGTDSKITKSKTPPELKKFYANEPMTNAELANLPMTFIKAQIGLDVASTKSPTKAFRSTQSRVTHVDNNDDIPLLALEKLPQNPEADTSENSPTCDSMDNERMGSDKRGGGLSYMASLSSRSNSDRYLTEILESSTRKQKTHSSPSINSSSKKKTSTKPKRPSASSTATAAAYGGFTSLPNAMTSSPKMKSNSKLLPRIQQ